MNLTQRRAEATVSFPVESGDLAEDEFDKSRRFRP